MDSVTKGVGIIMKKKKKKTGVTFLRVLIEGSGGRRESHCWKSQRNQCLLYNKGTKTSNNIGSSKPSHQHWAGVHLFLIFKKP